MNMSIKNNLINALIIGLFIIILSACESEPEENINEVLIEDDTEISVGGTATNEENSTQIISTLKEGFFELADENKKDYSIDGIDLGTYEGNSKPHWTKKLGYNIEITLKEFYKIGYYGCKIQERPIQAAGYQEFKTNINQDLVLKYYTGLQTVNTSAEFYVVICKSNQVDILDIATLSTNPDVIAYNTLYDTGIDQPFTDKYTSLSFNTGDNTELAVMFFSNKLGLFYIDNLELKTNEDFISEMEEADSETIESDSETYTKPLNTLEEGFFELGGGTQQDYSFDGVDLETIEGNSTYAWNENLLPKRVQITLQELYKKGNYGGKIPKDYYKDTEYSNERIGYQEFNTTINKDLTLKYFVGSKTIDVGAKFYVVIHKANKVIKPDSSTLDSNPDVIAYNVFYDTGENQPFTDEQTILNFNTGDNTNLAVIFFNDGTGEFYIDNIELEE